MFAQSYLQQTHYYHATVVESIHEHTEKPSMQYQESVSAVIIQSYS